MSLTEIRERFKYRKGRQIGNKLIGRTGDRPQREKIMPSIMDDLEIVLDLVDAFRLDEDELWTREQILLKLTEELGELAQAFRKKTRFDQEEEMGDLLFAALALCQLEHIDPYEVLGRSARKPKTEYNNV